jgi:hypothetical protein
MPSPDYATWLTKQRAADAIGCSTKTVEKLAQDGKLQQARWRRPTGGAAVAVFHPADVARVAQERRPGLPAFVLPATRDANGNGAGAIALPTAPAASDELHRAVVALVSEFAAAFHAVASEKSLTSQKSENDFLTIKEAAAIKRLSTFTVRRLAAEKHLKLERDRGRLVIRRRDLEAL